MIATTSLPCDMQRLGVLEGSADLMDNKSHKRVLVVDDDAQFVEAARMVLERHGYEVLIAHDGHEGLVQAELESPDLIVLDVMMPRRSGFGVLDRLRGCGTGPKIVMVTANDEERHREIARAKGAHGFLHKPFDMHELLRTVETLLHA